jgi:sporulation protein YlmC with PRC-barrel domain
MKTSLQNFNEVEGYSIHVTDGKLGHVEDFIIDDNSWQIVFLIIDTSSWPWGKKVILPINQVETIDFGLREAKVNLNSETVKNAPEFDSSRLYEDNYGMSLHDYYEKSYVK